MLFSTDRFLQLLLEVVAVVGILAGFLKIFGGAIVRHLLDRELEKHRAALRSTTDRELEQLRAASQREIEELRTKLQAGLFRHQETFASLNKKRAEVIANVYEKLSYLHVAMIAFLSKKTGSAESDTERATAAFVDFSRYYFSHLIYLEPGICKELEKIASEMYSAVELHPFTKQRGAGMLNPALSESEEKFISELYQRLVPSTTRERAQIEKSFRKMLGMETDI